MNYPEKREAIQLTINAHTYSGLSGGDIVDKILMLTEQALGAGQQMSHMPGLNDAHEAWLERVLHERRLVNREYEYQKRKQLQQNRKVAK